MEKKIVATVLFLISTGLETFSFRSFREKGFLFNNAYLYASKQEREQMNKKPHYRQSAIVFLLLGVIFALDGIELLLETGWLFWVVGITVAVTIVYAIMSSIMIEKRNRNQ